MLNFKTCHFPSFCFGQTVSKTSKPLKKNSPNCKRRQQHSSKPYIQQQTAANPYRYTKTQQFSQIPRVESQTACTHSHPPISMPAQTQVRGRPCYTETSPFPTKLPRAQLRTGIGARLKENRLRKKQNPLLAAPQQLTCARRPGSAPLRGAGRCAVLRGRGPPWRRCWRCPWCWSGAQPCRTGRELSAARSRRLLIVISKWGWAPRDRRRFAS